MDTFNFPVTDILLLDQSNNPIQIFNTTVKEKDVAIEFDRKEIKINRSYTLEEKKLLTKQMITGTFDIFMDLNTLKSLNYENVETKVLENYSVVFSNSKTKVSLTLKNCNISMKGKINFKINKLSNISFKAEAQGENNEFYEIKQGGDVLVIDFNYLLQEITKIKNEINILSKENISEPILLSATTTIFKKDQIYKDKNKLNWRVKADFTKSGGYPGGLPDTNFSPHSVLSNNKQINLLSYEKIDQNGWKGKKYNDGRLEINRNIGQIVRNDNTNTIQGITYYSLQNEYIYPIPFISKPSLSQSARQNAVVCPLSFNSDTDDLTKILYRIVSPLSFTSYAHLYGKIELTGRWK